MTMNDLRSRDSSLYTSLEISELSSSETLASVSQPKSSFKLSYPYLKQYVSNNWSSLFPIVIFLLVNTVLVILFLIFHTQVLKGLEELGLYLKTLGYLGMLIPITLIVIASFPPIPGYGTVSVLCGFVYGFPRGFIPPFAGGVIGASLCFLVSRLYGRDYLRKLLLHYTYIDAAVRAIEIKGVKLLFLVRIAPYPWTIMNFVLGATNLPYFTFISATALSLPKLLLHVYLGASAKSMLDGGASSPLKVGMLCFALFTGIGVTIYLYFVCRSVINDTLEEGSKNSDYGEDLDTWEGN